MLTHWAFPFMSQLSVDAVSSTLMEGTKHETSPPVPENLINRLLIIAVLVWQHCHLFQSRTNRLTHDLICILPQLTRENIAWSRAAATETILDLDLTCLRIMSALTEITTYFDYSIPLEAHKQHSVSTI